VKKSIVEELKEAQSKLLWGNKNPELLKIIRERIPNCSDNIFILNWIPEQAEDIFTVLLDGSEVIEVELSRLSGCGDAINFDVMSVHEYVQSRSLSKSSRQKLDAALELSKY